MTQVNRDTPKTRNLATKSVYYARLGLAKHVFQVFLADECLKIVKWLRQKLRCFFVALKVSYSEEAPALRRGRMSILGSEAELKLLTELSLKKEKGEGMEAQSIGEMHFSGHLSQK